MAWSHRSAFFIASLSVTACSFIDDFGPYGRTHDAGAPDAHEPDRDLDGGTEEGDDASAPDDAASDDASRGADGASSREDAGDGGAESDGAIAPGDLPCRGKPDGLSCGDGALICRKGFCRTSRCGDAFIDSVRGEQCDDGNLVAADGCEPSSCRFSCAMNEHCDNGYPCDGDELCDIATHRCLMDTDPATNKACQRASLAGVCNESGFCITPGCGDGVKAANEECDPKPPAAEAGCRTDCTRGCVSDAGCADGNECNGSETCDVATGTCLPGTKLNCADADPCTQDDVCDAMGGCSFPLSDGDGDQVSEQTCAAGSTLRGGDCDGRSAAIYPGATEYCDGADNDCDGMRDEGAVMATCYPDADGDGYPARQGATTSCTCASGTRLARADGAWDCADDPTRAGADVYPSQDAYFPTGYEISCASGNGTCVSFDYNCDGMGSGQYPSGSGSCGVLGLICAGDGYNGAAPACGQEGSFLICQGGGLLSCGGRSEQRRQACR